MEIKFKIYDKNKKEFVSLQGDDRDDSFQDVFKDDEYLFFQFILLKDINDKEIYYDCEIVKFKYYYDEYCNDSYNVNNDYIEMIGIFHFNDIDLRTEIEVFNQPNYISLWYDYERMKDFEIIGTYQENPKLVEIK
jgi:hypothetical protein